MDDIYPIYTEKAECQDCYKCVRNCPVKAIKLEDNRAVVIPSLCIYCGKCIEVCPVKAKRIREDLNRAKELLKLDKKVIVSLAPSFITEFKCEKSKLIKALKMLGFYGISETAIGADIVSNQIRNNNLQKGINISSACTTVVELIHKYYPDIKDNITKLYSPVLSHCVFLKKKYSEDIRIVFIGPCISKKLESDNNPDLLDVVLTFEDLRQWFEEEGINLDSIPESEDEVFIPFEADKSKLYPIDGGMIATIKEKAEIVDANFMCLSGVDNISEAIDDIKNFPKDKKNFFEFLACSGGCINGPGTYSRHSTLQKRLGIIEFEKSVNELKDKGYAKDLKINYMPDIVEVEEVSVEKKDIDEALKTIGKYKKTDELNCSGCGYNSCRDFAIALISNKAEKQMCVTYMRKLANKKANALINTIPMGLVIFNKYEKIIECNKNFIELIGTKDIKNIYNITGSLTGADMKKVIPFYDSIKSAVEHITDKKEIMIKHNNKVIRTILFNIEENHIMGGIFNDITSPVLKKEMIIKKSQNVIEKNFEIVQQIASLLGENAAETEIILNSIIKNDI